VLRLHPVAMGVMRETGDAEIRLEATRGSGEIVLPPRTPVVLLLQVKNVAL